MQQRITLRPQCTIIDLTADKHVINMKFNVTVQLSVSTLFFFRTISSPPKKKPHFSSFVSDLCLNARFKGLQVELQQIYQSK